MLSGRALRQRRRTIGRLVGLLDLDGQVPGCSTPSRRQQTLTVRRPAGRRAGTPEQANRQLPARTSCAACSASSAASPTAPPTHLVEMTAICCWIRIKSMAVVV
ncbi:hypothetical protein [Chitiniphilus purpureus]|uniref:hypothetical protein n=1 Tax=Chitiniphilus purpureus TaxID=2981137 RepID=UPI0038CC1B64